jgi:hypothetical protein
MLLTTTLGLITALATGAQDTTFAVSRDARLTVTNFAGTITVGVWNRGEVRIQTDADQRTLAVSKTGSVVRVQARGPYVHDEKTYTLTVPRWLPLELSGTETDIVVAGTDASITASTVDGDVTIRGGRGQVTVSSIEGDISIEGANAEITASSVDGDVTVMNSTGDVSAQSIDGAIELTDVTASAVKANTVDGDIYLRGPIQANGRYGLTTHDGDVTLIGGRDINATITVSTFAGEFESDFPVTIQGTTQRERFSFTLGTGSAQITLEAFDGTIRLQRGQ